MKIIAVKLQGRLGNQLFQYAFAYAEAKRLNAKFYLDKSTESYLLPLYFEVTDDLAALLDASFLSLSMKRKCYRFCYRMLYSKKMTLVGNRTPVAGNYGLFKRHCFYEGYFQSVTYFNAVKDEIRSLFQVKTKYIKAFDKLNQQFDRSKKMAVIHIRRGDYVDFEMALPLSYYKKAISLINDAGLQYVFVSDDPAFIEAEFDYLPDKYISVNPEIIDLQFLMNADICVLSCSSFSWWGAWLNTKENKQVYAPEYWLGFKDKQEYPVGIFEKFEMNLIQVNPSIPS